MSNYKINEKLIHRKPKVFPVNDDQLVIESVPKIDVKTNIDGYNISYMTYIYIYI